MGLPVSKTSWHCCGSQNSPALWPQNKASGARRRAFERPAGCSSGRGPVQALAQRGPLPRAMPRAPRARDASPQPGRWLRAAGLQSRAQEVSLSLRQLSPACCGRRLPRRRQSPARSRRAVGCMSSSRLYSPPPPAPRPRRPPRPQLLRSRHANFWLGTKGSARAGRGRALLPRTERPARPPLAASAGLAGGSPPPSPRRRAAAPRRPARAAPLETRERDAESQGEEGGGGGGAAAGARKGSDPSREGGGGGEDWRPRRRGRRFRAVRGQGVRAPAARLTKPTPTAPQGPRESPAPQEGERRGAVPARGSAAPRKSPDKGKPRPPPSGPTPCRPRRVRTRRAPSPAQGRANPERRPRLSTASGFWQGPFGATSAGGVAPAATGRTHGSWLQLYHQRLS